MTTVTTLNLPAFDDYTVESETVADEYYAHQKYYSGNNVIVEAFVYFEQVDGEPLKWPYKFVIQDHTGSVSVTTTEE